MINEFRVLEVSLTCSVLVKYSISKYEVHQDLKVTTFVVFDEQLVKLYG